MSVSDSCYSDNSIKQFNPGVPRVVEDTPLEKRLLPGLCGSIIEGFQILISHHFIQIHAFILRLLAPSGSLKVGSCTQASVVNTK